jgi:hypothetical protein
VDPGRTNRWRARLGLVTLMFVLLALPAAGSGEPASAARAQPVQWQVMLGRATVGARLLIGQDPVSMRVTLNGRAISGLFTALSPAAPAVMLGRDDNLRPGANTLVAAVLLASGLRVQRVARFRLSPSRVLATAGPDKTVYAGDRVTLSGAGSLIPGVRATQGTFSWRIISRPARSHAVLRNDASVRPMLVTDMPGVYRVELTVRNPAHPSVPAGADVVEIDSVDSRTTRAGIFVGTVPFNTTGPAKALQFFSGTLAGQYPLGSPSGPVVTFFLDRHTLAVIGGGPVRTGVSAADVTTLQARLAEAVATTGHQPLVVSAGNRYGTMSPAFATWIRGELGATGVPANATSFALTSVVPSFYSLTGQGTTANVFSVSPDTGGASRLAGQLVRDAQDNWVFTPSSVPAFGSSEGTEVRFDTASSGSIVVAGKRYPAQAQGPGCQQKFGGYELLALHASGPQALQPLNISVYSPLFNQTFTNGETFFINACTNGQPDDNESLTEAIGFRAVLNAIGSTPALVFIQSVGDPRAPSFLTNNSSAFTAGFGSEINRFGGSPKAFLGLIDGNQTETTGPFYALVGQNFALPGQSYIYSPAQVSTDGPGHPPARLVGVLVMDAYGQYVPTLSVASNNTITPDLKAPVMLSHLAQEVDPANNYVPDRFPHQGNPAYEAALQHAAQVIGITYQPGSFACYRPPNGLSDVRSNYCGGIPVGASLSHYWEDLYGNCSSNPNCLSQAPYVQNSAYTATVWSTVKQELQGEFKLVDEANQVAHALKQTLTAGMASDTSLIATALSTKFNSLANASLPSEGTSGLSWASDIFNLLGAVSGFFSGETSTLLWSVSAAIGVGHDAVTDSSGTPLLSGPLPGTAAASLSSQTANQVDASNLLVDKERDAIVSDWQRLQGIPADFARLPDSEQQDASVPEARYANIRYTWETLMNSAWTLNLLHDNSSGLNGPGTSIQDFSCAGPNGYQKPFGAFAYPETHYQYDGGSYALTIITPSPSGNGFAPAPASAFPQLAPTSILNGFFAAQPSSGSAIKAVVGAASPPGLGIDSRLFYSRLIAVSGGLGLTRVVRCN